MKDLKEFQLANEMLEKVLGGITSPAAKRTFQFNSIYALEQAQKMGLMRGCACGCACGGEQGGGGGAGSANWI